MSNALALVSLCGHWQGIYRRHHSRVNLTTGIITLIPNSWKYELRMQYERLSSKGFPYNLFKFDSTSRLALIDPAAIIF